MKQKHKIQKRHNGVDDVLYCQTR